MKSEHISYHFPAAAPTKKTNGLPKYEIISRRLPLIVNNNPY